MNEINEIKLSQVIDKHIDALIDAVIPSQVEAILRDFTRDLTAGRGGKSRFGLEKPKRE